MRLTAVLFTSVLTLAATPSRANAQHLQLGIRQAHNQVELAVTGAQPRMPVFLFVGSKEGHTLIFPGTDRIRPLTIGLAQPVTLLVLGTADAHGSLHLRFQVSGKLPRVLLQAVSPAEETHRHAEIIVWRLSRVTPTPHD